MNIIQRVQMESLKSEFFFCTLTYNPDSLPIYHVNGYNIPYADVSDVQKMVKRLRKNNSFGVPFRYFAVSEFGSVKGRPHFHILFMIEKKYLPDYTSCLTLEKKLFHVVLQNWTRNYGSHKTPDYRPLLTYKERWSRGVLKRNYDLHYVNPSLSSDGVSNVAWYVLKYMLKPSKRAERLQQALHLNLSEDEYKKVWNIVKPRYFKSLDFGLSNDEDIKDYLRTCIKQTHNLYDYPCFINPDTGQTFPLARFYKGKPDIYTISDALDVYYRQRTDTVDNSDYREHKSVLQIDKSIEDFINRQKLVDLHIDDDFLDL